MTLSIVVPFARANYGQNLNLQEDSADRERVTYFRAMVVTFASFRRMHSDLLLVLVTDEEPPQFFQDAAKRLQVEVRIISFSFRPPSGYVQRFSSSFFLFDAIRTQTEQYSFYVDPDVVCVKPLDALARHVGSSIAALPIHYTVNHDINGLSRAETAKLAPRVEMSESNAIGPHIGGEFFGLPLEWRDPLMARVNAAWLFSLAEFREGRLGFTTEEHILSFALREIPFVLLDEYVKRIWTATTYRNVDGTESALTVWHLPAEKSRGLAEVYFDATDASSWFWVESDKYFEDDLARIVGVRRRRILRFLRDVAGRCVSVITGDIGRG